MKKDKKKKTQTKGDITHDVRENKKNIIDNFRPKDFQLQIK